MATTDDLINAVNGLVTQLRQNSNSSGGSAAGSGFYSGGNYDANTLAQKRAALSMEGMEKGFTRTQVALNRLHKEITDGTVSLRHGMNAVSQVTKDSLQEMFDNAGMRDLQKIPESVADQLANLNHSAASAIKEFKDIDRTLNTLSDAADRQTRGFELQTRITEIMTGSSQRYVGELGELTKEFNDLNGTMGEFTNDTVEDARKQLEDFTDVVAQVSDAQKLNATNMMAMGRKVTSALAQFGAATMATVSPLMGLTKRSMAAGVEVNTAAFQYGLSSDALIASQKDSIQMIRATGMSFDQFNEQIHANAEGLLAYAGGTEEATRVSIQSAQMAQTLADNDAQRAQLENEQFNRFKRLNKMLSVTSEEFVAMNDQLMNSQEVQSQLFRLNKSQRAAFMIDLQNTYEKIRLDGLNHEQSLRMLDVLTEIGGKSAKERMKDAAKLQAFAGAIGMGEQGARAAALLRGGLRNEGDKAEFLQLEKEINAAASSRMGTGIAGEMVVQEMTSKMGLEQYVGGQSEFSKLETLQQNAIDEQKYTTKAAEQIAKIDESILAATIGGFDNTTAFLQSEVNQTLLGGFGLLASLIGITNVLQGATMWAAGIGSAAITGMLSATVFTIGALAIPVWAIVAGVAAVGALIWYFWDDIVEVWNSSVAWLGEKFDALSEWWENFSFGEMLSGLGDSIVDGLGAIFDFAMAPLNWISDGIDGIADWWSNFSFGDAISDTMTNLGDSVVSGIGAYFDFITTPLDWISSGIDEISLWWSTFSFSGAVQEGVSSLGDWIVSGIGWYFDVLMTPINLINDGIDAIKTWWENFSFADAIGGIIPDWMKDGANVAGALGGAVVDGAVAAADAVSEVAGNIADGVGSAVDAAGDLAGDAWSGVKNFFADDADPSKQIEAVAKLLADAKDETKRNTNTLNEVIAKLQTMLETEQVQTNTLVAVLGQISARVLEQTEMLKEQYDEGMGETKTLSEAQVRAIRRSNANGYIG